MYKCLSAVELLAAHTNHFFFLDDMKQQQIDSILVSTCLISTIGIWK